MKAVRFHEYGGIDVLRVEEVARPVPGPGQVLVEVRAAGIQPGEVMIREGARHDRWPATFPSGQGSDLAGVVVEAGPQVRGVAVGDEVLGFTHSRASHAEFVVVDDVALTSRPAGPGFTVAEFVEYFALLKDMPPRQVPRAVAAAAEQVGLGDKARSRLRTLSGGMLRRAGIAQAIVNQPELLLLDEPTAGLDPEQRVAFRALLRDLGERATVIVSTHLVEDVGAACGEVALMDSGKIVFRGTPDELTARGEGTGAAGDAPLERGYSAVLAAARSAAGVRS
jgi:ABC-type antimicrobial peptide transport system ATPase subunit